MSGDGTGPLAPYRSDRESRKPTVDSVGRFVLKCHGVGEPILRRSQSKSRPHRRGAESQLRGEAEWKRTASNTGLSSVTVTATGRGASGFTRHSNAILSTRA
jgi:hypothetical protein